MTQELNDVFITWGYPGFFVAALLSGSIVPFSSEVVLFALVKLGLDPFWCLTWGTAGNTLGSMSCYWLGRMGKTEWIERYLHVKREKVEHMQTFLQGKGSLMAFFSFLPMVGEVISIALGYLRSNLLLTFLSMLTGKWVRYAFIIYLMT